MGTDVDQSRGVRPVIRVRYSGPTMEIESENTDIDGKSKASQA